MFVLPPLFPGLVAYYLAPFLVACYYQCRFLSAVWISLFCGMGIDLLSDQRFGSHAVSYVITSLVLYRQRRHFFSDSLSTLPIMVYIFAVLTTFWLSLFHYLDKGDVVGLKQLLTSDMLILPLYDSLYAFLCFTLPAKLFSKRSYRYSFRR